jgi:hypothetical protein
MDTLAIESALIVGHSMGSYTAQRFAIERPHRTRGLVLAGSYPTAKGNGGIEELKDAVSALVDPIDPAFVRSFQASTPQGSRTHLAGSGGIPYARRSFGTPARDRRSDARCLGRPGRALPARRSGGFDANDPKRAAGRLRWCWTRASLGGTASVRRRCSRVCRESPQLYHQMRTRWPETCPYSVNGEVDKRNHPYLGEGAPKPDFLVHVPGTGDNDAAIEVKGPGAAAVGIRKDIGTLLTFRQWYGRVIYLVYGVHPHAALERVTTAGCPAAGYA